MYVLMHCFVHIYIYIYPVYVQIFAAHNFRGLLFPNISQKQFLRIKSFEYIVYTILKFRELNFRALLKSAKTAKIMRCENLDTYGIYVYSNVHIFFSCLWLQLQQVLQLVDQPWVKVVLPSQHYMKHTYMYTHANTATSTCRYVDDLSRKQLYPSMTCYLKFSNKLNSSSKIGILGY